MGAYLIDTRIPEMLSTKYGLRACEIIQKHRFRGNNPVDGTIKILGKGGRIRDIHLLQADYIRALEWYKSTATISYGTLHNRLKKSGVLEPGHKHRTTTHRGRKDRWASLPDDASFREVEGLGLELGQSRETSSKHYDAAQLDRVRKKNLLGYLPK